MRLIILIATVNNNFDISKWVTSLNVYNRYWNGGATIKLVWLWCQHNLKSWHKTFKQMVGSDYVVLVSQYVFYESRMIFLLLSKIYFTHIGLIWDGCHTISICKLCVNSWWRFALYWATSSFLMLLVIYLRWIIVIVFRRISIRTW